MHVLVATRATQGNSPGDFCWALDGELVRLPFDACDCSDCGCARSFAGMGSSKATTTAQVVKRDALRLDAYRDALRDTLVREGWMRPDEAADEEFLDDQTVWNLAAAAQFPAGAIIEIRDDRLRVRAHHDEVAKKEAS